MNDLENQFKQHFDNISWSAEKEKKIKSGIISGYKNKQKKRKIIFSLIFSLSMVLLGTGITYAAEIKESINKIITNISKEKTNTGLTYVNYKIQSDARKELNYDAKLSEPMCTKFVDEFLGISKDDECYSTYTYESLEQILGIKILKNDLFKHNEFILKQLLREDGKISFIELQMINPTDAKKNSVEIPQVYFKIYIRTKYSKSKNNLLWDVNLFSEDKVHEYNVKKLNTKAYGTNYTSYGRNVFLVYDDIIYRIKIATGKEPDKDTQKILDAFHY